MTNKDYDKQVKVVEETLRNHHLMGTIDFRDMAIAILAALSINEKETKKLKK